MLPTIASVVMIMNWVKAYFRPIAYDFDSHTASIKLTSPSQISLTWTWMIYFRPIGLDLIRLQF